MAYIRHDENNTPVNPQPGKTTVNQFSGNEGWTTVTNVGRMKTSTLTIVYASAVSPNP